MTVSFDKLGYEDIAFGTGTFNRSSRVTYGNTVVINEIDGNDLKTSDNAFTVEKSYELIVGYDHRKSILIPYYHGIMTAPGFTSSFIPVTPSYTIGLNDPSTTQKAILRHAYFHFLMGSNAHDIIDTTWSNLTILHEGVTLATMDFTSPPATPRDWREFNSYGATVFEQPTGLIMNTAETALRIPPCVLELVLDCGVS